jgi:hypothetical protein
MTIPREVIFMDKINYKEIKFMFEELGMTYLEISVYFKCNKSLIRRIAKRHSKMKNALSKKRKKIIERSKINVFLQKDDKLLSCCDFFSQQGKIVKDNIIFDLNNVDITVRNRNCGYIKNIMRLKYKIEDNKLILTPISSYKFAIIIYPYIYLYRNNPVETLKALDEIRNFRKKEEFEKMRVNKGKTFNMPNISDNKR